MAWTEFTLRVTTPLFTHDDPTTGLRVASLRGALHFWFRALAASHTGNDLTALARAEQAVFGSTRRASPVRLRLTGQPTHRSLVKTGESPAFLTGPHGQWTGYLLGQGHAKYDPGTQRGRTTRPHTRPGHTFTLKIAFSGDEAVDTLALASLWLMCTYGGLGARTRRGFGGVRLAHEHGPLPGPWKEHSPDTPGPDHYTGRDHLPAAVPVGDCAEHLRHLAPKVAGDAHDRAPDYPALGPGATVAALGESSTEEWWQIAAETGETYRRFRASIPHPATDPGYHPPIKTPEHQTVIHGPDRHFPLGALGLPVNYQGGATVNATKNGLHLRRASPLWLRFVSDPGRQRWRLFTFAFHNPFLPSRENVGVRVTGQGATNKDVVVSDPHVRERTRAWMDLIASAQDDHEQG